MMIRTRWIWIPVAALFSIATPRAQFQPSIALDNAEALLRTSEYPPARRLFEQALENARRTGTDVEIARALLGLAEISQREGDSAAGRPAVVEAMAIAERLDNDRLRADALLRMALIESAAKNRAAAIAGARQALTIYERIQHHRGIGAATFRIADMQQDLNLDDRGRLLEGAAASARLGGDRRLEGTMLHSQADRLFTVGRYQEALDWLSRATEAFESAGARTDLGTVYNSIGRVYRAHGRFDEALKAQQTALALHRAGSEQFALLQSLNAVSVVQQYLGEHAAARKHLQEAIDLGATMPSTAAGVLRARDFLRANMAAFLINDGDFESAAAMLEQVIADGRDSFPSLRYAQLSLAYTRLGRASDALAAAEHAVRLCGTDKIACIGATNARSNALAASGRREGALQDLALTLRGLEEVRAQLVPTDFLKQDFSTAYRRYYNSAIARQFESGLERESLETAELARSRAFLDLLASRSIAPAADGPLRSPIATASATAADLIRTAQRLKSTLVLFWVADTETFTWVVTPEGQIHARQAAIARTRLASLIRRTAPFAPSSNANRGSTPPASLKESSASWRQLHALLIEPIKSVLPRHPGALLTLVPHDALTNLSFAALQNNRGRYLLEDYTLHYAAAGALFQFTNAESRRSEDAAAMLMVADPATVRRSNLDADLPRLPGAQREAAAIGRQMKAPFVLSLNGESATEAAVRAQAPARSILHFAAHAVVRDDDPFASFVALAGSGAAEESDGALTAHEVYRLKLDAALVVLSACRSASGVIAGDGVAAFARAFVYAGASSLIASVWDVADEPSNRLLPAFYRAWLGGATKAAALREAQLQLLDDLRRGRVRVTTPVGPVPVPQHPVFWAGFVLFGEPD